MGTVSQKLTALFFDCVRSKIEAGQPAAAEAPATTEAAPTAPPADVPPAEAG
jgi:hypothetical protein